MIEEQEFFVDGSLVEVLTTQPIDRLFTYKAPSKGCYKGAFVLVPLGRRKVIGLVWGASFEKFDPEKIKTIEDVLDYQPIQPELQNFIQKVADYTISPLFAVLRLVTRVRDLAAKGVEKRVIYKGKVPRSFKMTIARKRVLETLDEFDDIGFSISELAKLAKTSPSVINTMIPSGSLISKMEPKDLPYPKVDTRCSLTQLNEDQARVVSELNSILEQKKHASVLLCGVTGSGKTAVYLEAIAKVIDNGQQALVLLPEIALTGEFTERLKDRFGVYSAEWHSGISQSERRRVWKMVGCGQAQIVVGARSALFLPFEALGLIVVDEEHDSSYKQQDGVLYNARDMAVLRASLASAKVILASATPSLETWNNATSGKYKRLNLMARYGSADLPDIKVIDMRDQTLKSDQWISPILKVKIDEAINSNEQALLFLNRRGYAPVTLCRSCGERIGCDFCDTAMIEHRFQKRLMCHQCGETKPIPTNCPNCQAVGNFAPIGPGVERLAEEAAKTFPGASITVLSSDLYGSARSLKNELANIACGNTDIIIGTQLIAKGHNFPDLTVVGVVDPDLGLQGSDLRAAERTFQLLRQVSGRAGRRDKKGTAYLQTYQPLHPVIEAIKRGHDEQFWTAEANGRKLANMPPFGRLVGILISAKRSEDAFELGLQLSKNSEVLNSSGITLYGPAPAPIARVRGRYRVRLLLKGSKNVLMQSAVKSWVSHVKLKKDIRLTIDVDPQSFL